MFKMVIYTAYYAFTKYMYVFVVYILYIFYIFFQTDLKIYHYNHDTCLITVLAKFENVFV